MDWLRGHVGRQAVNVGVTSFRQARKHELQLRLLLSAVSYALNPSSNEFNYMDHPFVGYVGRCARWSR